MIACGNVAADTVVGLSCHLLDVRRVINLHFIIVLYADGFLLLTPPFVRIGVFADWYRANDIAHSFNSC